MSTFRSIIRGVTPSFIVDRLRSRKEMAREARLRVEFYKDLIGEGKLVFDVGANVGNRVAAFLELKDRVVAVEPQPSCVAILEKRFGKREDLTVINKALGASSGKVTLHASSDTDTLATVSDSFVDYAEKSKRFEGKKYETNYEVGVITLDSLIASHGIPDFIKIDVEGYELEVLKGLSKAPDAVSFEFTPDCQDTVIECLAILNKLGLTEFNISYGESMRFARTKWIPESEMANVVEALRGDTYLFADIYARKP